MTGHPDPENAEPVAGPHRPDATDPAGPADPDELDDDELLALAALLLDPLPDPPVPPLGLSREHFLALASDIRRERARPRRRARGLASVTAFVAVLATVGLVVIIGIAHRNGGVSQDPSASAAPVPAPAPLRLAAPQPAAGRLAELAERARQAAPVPGIGSYTYVRTRQWTSPPGGGAAPVTDEQTWWGPDMSGQHRSCPVSGFTASRPPVSCGIREAVVPASAPIMLQAPSEDPALLAVQLAHAGALPDTSEQAQVFFDRVVALMRTTALTPAQRAAALRILADTPGIVHRGEVADPMGRRGLAVTVDPAQRAMPATVAVFDMDSGQLLAVERLTQPSGATGAVDTFELTEAVMLLEIRRTDQPT
ncbi:CU044_5270 family protein [Dactylosporangium sp. NBC_01737]|uniref:CU044_5270 family protein n=1 Tax=Dactylosporangium sp. NBC_01737 TaxID=2975959 RepID=UPI002E14B50C|nr:CU044_5270 family protein [Dactylosporangium sp. NBC_01737]